MFSTVPRLLARPSAVPASGEPIYVDPAQTTAMPSVVGARREPDAAAAALVVLDPDGAALNALNVLHAPAMSDTGLIDALIASEKLLATVSAKQQEFLAEIARRDPDGELYLRDEAACALKIAPATAATKLDDAVQLTGRLADTNDLVAGGFLSAANARHLARGVKDLPDGIAVKVQDRVLPRGCAQTPGEFRAAVRRAVAKLDRKDEAQRHADAYAKRNVISYPTDDYMADVVLHLAADGAEIVTTAINAWAVRTGRDDKRTADQRRADAIVDICSHALALPGLPTQHGVRPTVNVTIAESTLNGEDEQPAHLDGYGPIPAAMARRLADLPGAHQHRYVVDPQGRVLDKDAETGTEHNAAASKNTNTHGKANATDSAGLTSPRYTPPARIARHVIVRDSQCVHPGCRRKAWRCQLDHRVPWPDGPTSAANLQPLCKSHHDLKHHSQWRVRRCDDGSYEWTSPTRHTYRYRPPEMPVPQPPAESEPVEDAPPPF